MPRARPIVLTPAEAEELALLDALQRSGRWSFNIDLAPRGEVLDVAVTAPDGEARVLTAQRMLTNTGAWVRIGSSTRLLRDQRLEPYAWRFKTPPEKPKHS